MAGAEPAPGRPALPPLPKRGAPLVPCTGLLSSLPLSGLRRLLYAADGDGLRQDTATTGHPGVAAPWCGQRRADGAPRARAGVVTQTAPYPTAAHPGQSER